MDAIDDLEGAEDLLGEALGVLELVLGFKWSGAPTPTILQVRAVKASLDGYCRATCEAHGMPHAISDLGGDDCGCPCHNRGDNDG